MTGPRADRRFKVFGIGAQRTGTRSLASALAELGFATAHWKEHHEGVLEAIERSDFRHPIFERYRAFTDLPVPAVFAQLDAAHPGSRFILTTRAEDVWLASVRAHLTGPDGKLRELGPSERVFYRTTRFDEAHFRQRLRAHHRDVLEHFEGRPDALLVLDLTANRGEENWRAICEFLGEPVPDTAFPHDNRTPR